MLDLVRTVGSHDSLSGIGAAARKAGRDDGRSSAAGERDPDVSARIAKTVEFPSSFTKAGNVSISEPRCRLFGADPFGNPPHKSSLAPLGAAIGLRKRQGAGGKRRSHGKLPSGKEVLRPANSASVRHGWSVLSSRSVLY
jgi:hypothetical protein